jgi:hypothetical protein
MATACIVAGRSCFIPRIYRLYQHPSVVRDDRSDCDQTPSQ